MFADLHAKRVLLTGGGAGIGKATVLAFSTAGARVHLADLDVQALDDMSRDQGDISYTVTNVGDEQQVERFISEGLERMGGVDVLVNNAGSAGPAGPLETLDSEAWRATFDVNVHSTFYCCKHVLPLMKAAGEGIIINISSTAGIMGYPLRTPYAAAKWAVTGLTHSLAMEAGPHGVRVNAICPGAVSGDRMERVIANEAQAKKVPESEVRDAYLKQCSLRTFIDPEDIAAMILFLCSGAGRRITGQAISVDADTHSLA